jgi:hypothetical protein
VSAWRILLLVVALAAGPAQPDPKYFQQVCDVAAADTAQTYVSITPQIWRNATSDLRDLRLYDGTTQVPYLLTPGSGEEVRGTEQNATVLNLGRVNGETQFVLDTRQGDTRAAYDTVNLKLRDDTPDFVTSARIEGFEHFGDTPVDLGRSTLFKLEREKLGANLAVKFHPAVFRYVRISIPKLDPHAITGAHVFSPGTTFGWMEVPVSIAASVHGQDSIYEWDTVDTVPVGRVEFASTATKDFWRRVDLQGERGYAIASGAIWSIASRDNTERSTNFELLVPGEARSKHFKLIVHNGDDMPLQMTIRTAYRERRLYFTPQHAGTLRLYFGDADLERPTYDYAHTQAPVANAKLANIGAVMSNPAYVSRPDQRPWTERHPAVLWIALGIAVLGLGAVALKSLTGTREQGTGNREQKGSQ